MSKHDSGMKTGIKLVMIRYTLFLLFTLIMGLCPLSAVYSQKDTVRSLTIDNSPIVPRSPDARSIEAFRRDRDYRYGNDPVPPANPFEAWLAWLVRKFNALFSSKYYDGFWQYVIMAVTAGLVVFLLYKAKVLEYAFSPGKAEALDNYVVGQENIHEINFEEAIAKALEQGDFRLAIRLQYLKLLKLLTNRELIHWKPSLTNQSYVQELEKYPFHADFVQITKYFEFVWYGDFQINEPEFKEMKAFSNSFQEKAKL